ncbi:hypothetical protein B6N60_02666 [Richelia sinica FACHB-800]|uniref:Uncharacterized protein n=1 Tax=Richelia sinica FACHB-800 TaxID=1357546 RepID=A0A975T8F9_9NOST|nr:hypothetical protein [Richelia sinica]MBD2665927.1 hypothetical protein [Richelia sinica FACHB-800]QXE23964.1 hypothetical protein B6N60_02666 [Richelia sinica FACHB-800]
MEIQEKIEFVGLPLAVYREIAAHLRQVEGVKVDLIPQTSTHFDYYQSQVSGLTITWPPETDLTTRQYTKEILAYYRNRYGG